MTFRVALVDDRLVADPLPQGLSRLGQIGGALLLGEIGPPLIGSRTSILVGWAFRAASNIACDQIAELEGDQIAASEGRWAIDNLWGNYLLFWADPAGRAHVLRSPVTGPAMYHAVEGAHAVAFTDLALARTLGFALDKPDPRAIDAELRVPLLRGHATGLAGVREILPGETVRLGCATALESSWSPWNYVGRPRRVAPEVLRTRVMSCVSAWSRSFGRIQLELSGGLDSSIVAACLAGRGPEWRAITIATPDPDGDERFYARAAADRARVPLIELLLSDAPADPAAPVLRLRARPGGFGLLAPVDAALQRAAAEYGAEAIFTGAGGDNVFGYLTSAAPVVDAFRFEGALSAWRVAGDLARVMNDNVWKAIGLAARKLVVADRLWPTDSSLLSDRFADNGPLHPWFGGADRAWPGQRSYALKLLPIQPFLDGYDRALAIPMIAPLLSQPIVELGLGIASWQWGEGGRDRALARAAFRSDLPGAVLARRVKGRIESLFYPSFDRNRARLRQFLLDGWLAGERMLDIEAIEALIDGRVRTNGIAAIRLLHIADMERWVRSIAMGSAALQARTGGAPGSAPPARAYGAGAGKD